VCDFRQDSASMAPQNACPSTHEGAGTRTRVRGAGQAASGAALALSHMPHPLVLPQAAQIQVLVVIPPIQVVVNTPGSCMETAAAAEVREDANTNMGEGYARQ
jgi:hypothetical protein